MAGNEPAPVLDPWGEAAARRRRRRARVLVPLGVAGVTAATIGLIPALAASTDAPDLPATSAEKLLEKLAGSKVETVSGTVRLSTDLGLPGLLTGRTPKLSGSPFGPGPGGWGEHRDGRGGEESADPRSRLTGLLSGTHTMRVAADGPDRHRVSIAEDGSDYTVVHNGKDVWAYDSASKQAYHFEVPEERRGGKRGGHGLPDEFPTTPEEAAERVLEALDPTTSVTVDGTTRVAGRDAYKLKIAPKQSGSTIDHITIAVDAENGAPLKFTLAADGGGKPVFDIGFSEVSFAKPAARTFEFTPPKGTKVIEAEERHGKDADKPGHGRHGVFGLGGDGLPGGPVLKDADPDSARVIGKGWTAIAELKLTDGAPGKAFKGFKDLDKPAPGGFNPGSLLESFGDEVSGDFGRGMVVRTRLINALITDDGKVYLGAVTKDALIKAAEGG